MTFRWPFESKHSTMKMSVSKMEYGSSGKYLGVCAFKLKELDMTKSRAILTRTRISELDKTTLNNAKQKIPVCKFQKVIDLSQQKGRYRVKKYFVLMCVVVALSVASMSAQIWLNTSAELDLKAVCHMFVTFCNGLRARNYEMVSVLDLRYLVIRKAVRNDVLADIGIP